MKKLILLVFIPFVFACSNDEDTPNMCVDETLQAQISLASQLLNLYAVVTVTHIIIVVRLLIGMVIAYEDGLVTKPTYNMKKLIL